MLNESIAPMPKESERSSCGLYLRTNGNDGWSANEKSDRYCTKRGMAWYVSNIPKRESPGGSLMQFSRQLCFPLGPWIIVTQGSSVTKDEIPIGPHRLHPFSR